METDCGGSLFRHSDWRLWQPPIGMWTSMRELDRAQCSSAWNVPHTESPRLHLARTQRRGPEDLYTSSALSKSNRSSPMTCTVVDALASTLENWWASRDSNPHASRHWLLRPARMPIPPEARTSTVISQATKNPGPLARQPGLVLGYCVALSAHVPLPCCRIRLRLGVAIEDRLAQCGRTTAVEPYGHVQSALQSARDDARPM